MTPCVVRLCLWLYFLSECGAASAFSSSEVTFDPFSDNIPYTITWPGAALVKDPSESDGNFARVITRDNENYVCFYEQPEESGKAKSLSEYDGPSPHELLQAMFSQNSCSYRIESYWAYELCHGKHFKQYHETKDAASPTGVTSAEYFLGFYKGINTAQASQNPVSSSDKPSQDAGEGQAAPTLRLDGEQFAYVAVVMEGGTPCDLTSRPRRTTALYVCHQDARGELYDLTETSSCEYRVVVVTSALCQHPSFRKDRRKPSPIRCQAAAGAPARPRLLVALEGEGEQRRLYNKPQERQVSEAGADPDIEVVAPSTRSAVPEDVRTEVGSAADDALLQEFLRGDYCIQGGSGWWMHEFCFGRHAAQFHPEANGRRTDVVLGRWDEQAHLDWLDRNPSKRPKPRDKRRSTSLYYTNGDVCDVNGKARVVEVKLKCAVNAASSHYVSVYLLEPKTCEYIMTIESPILCQVIAQADDNGIVMKP